MGAERILYGHLILGLTMDYYATTDGPLVFEMYDHYSAPEPEIPIRWPPGVPEHYRSDRGVQKITRQVQRMYGYHK